MEHYAAWLVSNRPPVRAIRSPVIVFQMVSDCTETTST
ncbi:hypothetical protein J2X98_003288 [Pseudarthrobacter enclensis]|uniref:Uncharacterized protein n=1 Tax=Pseudarthrobacter enclensis TaxID=993070 RepID=A0ABT9RX77_9MICC|nr:hypothetical protein [Pseudarthrobacter enclensis]